MKKYAYYHLYLTEDVAAWSLYLLDNHKKMEDTGLLDELEKIHLVVVGNHENIQMAYRIIRILDTSNKYDFHAYENVINDEQMKHVYNNNLKNNEKIMPITENVTLKKIYDHACVEEAYFLYNHSKGITSFERSLKLGLHDMHKIDIFINYYYWKEFLSWGVIDKWRDCVSALDNLFDTAAANYSDDPKPHYSGNVWWSKSSHISKLPDPSSNNWWFDLQEKTKNNFLKNATLRFKDEFWICNIETKSYNIIDMNPVVSCWKKTTKNLYA